MTLPIQSSIISVNLQSTDGWELTTHELDKVSVAPKQTLLVQFKGKDSYFYRVKLKKNVTIQPTEQKYLANAH
ncbi:hypothetical protein D5018_21455 [Parashewanella curva]|uniref:Uncharacterized protein n=1 Tax=Parashewanella curva TaxID=2338552 RepID=A0A3L8PQK7_9GAMM|nr:hypothetical protein [Parashewanella curva]RLV57651.1 hypothetical protein D5018_21455 [Parashewanella curva]